MYQIILRHFNITLCNSKIKAKIMNTFLKLKLKQNVLIDF